MESTNISKPITIILAIWFAYLFLLGILQILGHPYGFKVWPLGEDRTFLQYFIFQPGFKAAKLWWSGEHRNPLAVWWWIAISPLIKSWDYGLYLIRKLIDPALAVVIFLLLDRLGNFRCRHFSLSVAIVVLMWNFSVYTEQILWVCLAILAVALLSVFFYCRYVDNQRRNGADLALSLVLYLVAIASYTLSGGVVISIILLSFFRSVSPQLQQNLILRVRVGMQDSLLYLSVFTIYLFFWYATGSGLETDYYPPNFFLIKHAFFASVTNLLWPLYYGNLLKSIWLQWSVWTIVFALSVAFFGAYLIFNPFYSKNRVQIDVNLPVHWVLALLISIALPIVFVESTNSVLTPGTRSPMIQQIWHPLFFVSLFFILLKSLNFFLGKNNKSQNYGYCGFIVCFFTLVVLSNLNYNNTLVVMTEYQQTLANGLRKIPIPNDVTPFFIVKTFPPFKGWSDPLDYEYAITIFKRSDVSLSILQPKPVDKIWKVYFGPQAKGVSYIGAASTAPIPYKNVWIVYYDGAKVWVPPIVTKQDLVGFQVEWQRDLPIDQTEKA